MEKERTNEEQEPESTPASQPVLSAADQPDPELESFLQEADKPDTSLISEMAKALKPGKREPSGDDS